MTKNVETVSISLNKGENGESSLYRLKCGTTLHLIPSPSLLGHEVALYSNYPVDEKSQFVRSQYKILPWYTKNGEYSEKISNQFIKITDINIYAEVNISKSGTYHFYFTFKEENVETHNGGLYIQVEPKLRVGPPAAQKTLQLDSIRCQTVLAKCLGPLNTWEGKLRVSKESGYNLIHFTPIQELGGSRSSYSLKNQLEVNPDFSIYQKGNAEGKLKKATFEDVRKIIRKCQEEWGIASISDIVLNHTANESEWLKEHPEATYSCFTCPHLRPAFLLDITLAQCGSDVAAGILESFGIPNIVDHEHHIQALRHQLHINYLSKVKIYELYQCNISLLVNKFIDEVRKRPPPVDNNKEDKMNTINLIQDPEYRRLNSTIDLDQAIDIFNVFRADCFDEDTRIKKCAESFRLRLEYLNETIKSNIQEHLSCAVENCLAGIQYERVEANGPRIKEISIKHPLFSKYFTHTGTKGKSLKEIEELIYDKNTGKYFMAHNGWVMNGDPLKDFASSQAETGNVYLRRELIAWGDSIKLRYGDKLEDNPYLWDHMRKYVENTAKIFQGVRLDNCHSTPLHVAEYLLDCARKVNPDLYVVAELFTNSDLTDNVFVNRLGITSLIREAQSAWDGHEEGRLVYRYGGIPVGAFFVSPERSLVPNIAHALFMDLTHDNPSPIEKRSVFDVLPTSALVSMAYCATGSNRGYDELVPHHIHVVDEERQYQEWDKGVDFKSGIISAKRALNLLHGELAEQGFNQIFVDQMSPDVIAITRHSPSTHQSVILVAHTSFSYPEATAGPTKVRPLRFEGNLDEIILEAELINTTGKPFDKPFNFKMDKKYINGLTDYKLKLNEHIPLSQSNILRHNPVKDDNTTQLDIENLNPGSVVAIRISSSSHIRPHFVQLQELIDNLHFKKGKRYEELVKIISKMNLVDMNYTIFHCDAEERDMGLGLGAYDIPGFGPINYCGLQGFISLLTEIGPNNNLGHPFCNNLRMGNWMIDYIHNRLSKKVGTSLLSKWIETNFQPLKEIPRYLIPSYFDVILTGVFNILVKHTLSLMGKFIKNGPSFPQALGLATIQFCSVCKSADLPKLSPHIQPPKPPEHCVTLSAGLPHFATGFMRCWGRDTFISLRGLLYLTGQFNEARYIILGFAACMRHGLIPNLLDNGKKPRYNCRDAVWWWFYSIKLYVQEAPNGKEILKEKVSRIYPTDDGEPKEPGEIDQNLYDVMQEALLIHFQGKMFRERNAGKEIDEQMTDEGFNIQIGIHPDTGFVFGGNDSNCGTWMDKMGSSEKAGNKGIPSTPRDGSAVELVGLQTAALRLMQDLSERGLIPYNSVERISKTGQKTIWSYKEWADKIVNNFEKYFYIDHKDNPEVNKIEIYKDCVGASQTWTDYQLRCNFPIAMVVAPELFNADHAWKALEQTRKYLLGPLGIKTLDPEDWAYRGFYNNSNDSTDPSIAHGANYHQGPEWLWPVGFYLRARLIFSKQQGNLKKTISETWRILSAHLHEIQNSPWRGLPELTNENGAYCNDSSRTQAWSVSTILEVLYDLYNMQNDK